MDECSTPNKTFVLSILKLMQNKGRKEFQSQKINEKCHLLGKTWLLQSQTHSSCRCLHWVCTREWPITSKAWIPGASGAPLLIAELFATNRFRW